MTDRPHINLTVTDAATGQPVDATVEFLPAGPGLHLGAPVDCTCGAEHPDHPKRVDPATVNREVHEARRLLFQFWDFANLCYCGNTDRIIRVIHGALLAHSEPGENFKPLDDALTSDATSLFVIYALDAWGLTEHGGSVYGGWLTPDGVRLRNALRLIDPGRALDDDWDDAEDALYPDGRPGLAPNENLHGTWVPTP